MGRSAQFRNTARVEPDPTHAKNLIVWVIDLRAVPFILGFWSFDSDFVSVVPKMELAFKTSPTQ